MLHLLNGDSTLETFRSSGIGKDDDVEVWREMLSEGPVSYDTAQEDFQKTRLAFFHKIGVSEEEYERLSGPGWKTLARFTRWEDVTLWFEYDVFCQINLIALLSRIHHTSRWNTAIFLVCTGDLPGYPRRMALGELDAALYPELYDSKIMVFEEDMAWADRAWRAFCSKDPRDLLPFTRSEDSPKLLPYLAEALMAHLRRFPQADTGLNDIEASLLSLAHQGFADKTALVSAAMAQDHIYKLGDGTYFRILEGIAPLLESFSPTRLSPQGLAVLEGRETFRPKNTENPTLGGAKKYAWVWKEGALVPQS
ncbi:MAG: hypothetical protein EAZ89_20865 [Bacteroidetes bacterium]|nr:MAG: hypothetical protein EAZ89_20865 [Bacteroidota bacterium]